MHVVVRDIGFTGYRQVSDSTTSTNGSRESIHPHQTLFSFADWLTLRNEFYNSKAGHAYLARIEAEEEAKKMKQPTKG